MTKTISVILFISALINGIAAAFPDSNRLFLFNLIACAVSSLASGFFWELAKDLAKWKAEQS